MRPDPLASDPLASDCKFTPYWWDQVDLAALAEPSAELPERVARSVAKFANKPSSWHKKCDPRLESPSTVECVTVFS